MPLTWPNVEESYPLPGTPRRTAIDMRLWPKARERTVNGLWLGDSKRKRGSSGDIYQLRLNAAFAEAFGNLPASPWMSPTFAGGGAPPGQIVVSAANAGQQNHDLDASLFPPDFAPHYHTSATYGALYQLLDDCKGCNREARLYGAPLFDASGRVDLDVLVWRREQASGQIRLEIAPQDGIETSYSATVIETRETANADLAAGGATQPLLFTFTNLPLGGKRYRQVWIKGTSASDKVLIQGARFRNVTNPTGVVVTSMSEGGYRADSWIPTHAGCGPLLALMGFDFVCIDFGVNDANAGRTPAQFKQNVQSLIMLVRAALPECVIFLFSSEMDARAGWGGTANHDQYAGSLRELVDENANTILINRRRRLHRLGHVLDNELITGTTDRGEYAAATNYNVGDLVRPPGSAAWPMLYRNIKPYTSVSFAADGPGMSGGHNYWQPWRYFGASITDTTHHSAWGQTMIAQGDVLSMLGAGPGRAGLFASRRY